MSSQIKHILIVSNTSWTIFNFRKEIVVSLLQRGFEVTALCRDDGYRLHLADLGCNFIDLNFNSSSLNPIDDLRLFLRLLNIYRKNSPDVILHYTIKPVIYGSMAGFFVKGRIINNIAGLGSLFIQNNWKTKLVMLLYRISQSSVDIVFFQNDEDKSLFLNQRIVKINQVRKINGSGVDLQRFNRFDNLSNSKGFTFLFSGRLLKEKGIYDFIEAAKALKPKYPLVKFEVVGIVGFDNPSSIPFNEVQQWHNDGIIEFLGRSDEVEKILLNCDCLVSPSYYREGVPRTLIEAAAMKVPVVAYNSIGTKDIISDGVNGYLVNSQDVSGLIQKMEKMISLSNSERRTLGENGRKIAEEKFDVESIIQSYLGEINLLSKT